MRLYTTASKPVGWDDDAISPARSAFTAYMKDSVHTGLLSACCSVGLGGGGGCGGDSAALLPLLPFCAFSGFAGSFSSAGFAAAGWAEASACHAGTDSFIAIVDQVAHAG